MEKKGKKYFTTQLSAEFLSLESKIDAIKRVLDNPKKYGVSAKQLDLLKKTIPSNGAICCNFA